MGFSVYHSTSVFAAIFDIDGIVFFDSRSSLRTKITATVFYRDFPFICAVCSDLCKSTFGAGFAAFGGGCEDYRFKIQIESGTHSVLTSDDIEPKDANIAVTIHKSGSANIVTRGAQPPIAGCPARMLRINDPKVIIYIICLRNRKRPKVSTFNRVSADMVVVITIFTIISTIAFQGTFTDCAFFPCGKTIRNCVHFFLKHAVSVSVAVRTYIIIICQTYVA